MNTFVLKREYTLQLPNNYVDIDKDEMEYIDGGYAIAVSPDYVSKAACTALATELWENGVISYSNINTIAKEIRGHAVAYYGLAGLSSIGISGRVLNELKSSANPIDIRDGADSRWYIVLACNLIWTLPD